MAKFRWFICDCQNVLPGILLSAIVSPLGPVPLLENAVSQLFFPSLSFNTWS